MRDKLEVGSVIMSIALVASMATAGAVLGTGMAGAAHPDDAPDLTEYADFTTNFPAKTDHYPGDINEENGSIEYFASGAEAFDQQDAEEGVWIDWIIVHANNQGVDWIDYSACETANTEAFGIDRGNNNSGTNYDEDLVQKQKRSIFRDDGIVINFYNWEDFGGDPPYMAPEDAIVASQGAGSSEGPCLTLTSDPGWYRIEAFMNGTIADNGRNEQPSENAERASLQLNANWMYVCECEDGQEAREQLGNPPNESSDPTPTPDDSDDPTPTPTPDDSDDPTPTPDDSDEPTPTATESGGGGGGGGGGSTQTQSNGGGGGGGGGGDGATTPTVGQGPGFGSVAALIALLGAALLANRRR